MEENNYLTIRPQGAYMFKTNETPYSMLKKIITNYKICNNTSKVNGDVTKLSRCLRDNFSFILK